MGIPSYLRLVAKNASKAILDSEDELNIDVLCIDGNPDLYAAHHIVLSKHETKCMKSVLDKEIIDLVIERYANEVKKIKPSTLYLAIDGVPPRAKIHLQRLRRYHKLTLQAEKDRLYKKYDRSVINEWDTSQFTPGTVFMQKLHLALLKAIKSGKFECENVIYSGHLEPGEGEHKWNKYLRSLPAQSVCFRSNDGDLIVLGNQFPQHDVYILTTLDEVKVYVHINQMQDDLIRKYRLPLNLKEKIMNDYVFFVNFCGNDFVKAFPFNSMRHRGAFDFVMKTYGHILKTTKQHLIEDGVLNMNFFKKFIDQFARVQNHKMADKYRRALSFIPREQDPLDDPLEDELAKFEHNYFYDPSHPYHETIFPEFKKINYNKPGYHDQYYKHFFGITKVWDRAAVCRQYLKSLMFCYHYYTDEVPSWEYCYPYRMAPLPQDVQFFLRKFSNEKIIVKDQSIPYSPLELQMLVLPPSNKILPNKFNDLMQDDEIRFYYPDSFDLDVLQGEKFIYSEPILPDILDENITKTILDKVKSVALTETERKRYTNES